MSADDPNPATSPILLVDDEPIVLQSLQMVLEHAGYRTHCLTSGSDAVQFLEGDEPLGLALVDLILPDIHGEEVLNLARKLRPGVPLVAMSGYGDRLEASRSALSVDGFLAKPFDRKLLVELVDSLAKAPS